MYWDREALMNSKDYQNNDNPYGYHPSIAHMSPHLVNQAEFIRTDLLRFIEPIKTIHTNCITEVLSLDKDIIIAGSSVIKLIDNSVESDDIDIYFNSTTHARDFISKLHELAQNDSHLVAGGAVCTLDTGQSLVRDVYDGRLMDLVNRVPYLNIYLPNIGKKIQLITTMGFNSAEHVLNTYDMYHCKVGISGGMLVMHQHAMMLIYKRQIVLDRNVAQPASKVMSRVMKYVKRGFTLPENQFGAIDIMTNSYYENGEPPISRGY